MGIIIWIIVGGIIGWVASLLTKKDSQMGIIANIIVGIVGSFVGGWIASMVGYGSFGSFDIIGLLFALLGAVIVIVVIDFVKKMVK